MWTWQRIAEAALVCACSVVVHVVNWGGVAKISARDAFPWPPLSEILHPPLHSLSRPSLQFLFLSWSLLYIYYNVQRREKLLDYSFLILLALFKSSRSRLFLGRLLCLFAARGGAGCREGWDSFFLSLCSRVVQLSLSFLGKCAGLVCWEELDVSVLWVELGLH